ncbi:MAG: DNA-processing protein DprA [Aestuariibacter sp.]
MSQQGQVATAKQSSTSLTAASLSLKQWLTINAMSGIGPATIDKLWQHDQCLTSIATCDTANLRNYGFSAKQLRNIANPDLKQVEADLAWLESSSQRHIISIDSEFYPAMLREISAAPILLYCEGNIALLSAPSMAIVGSRACTLYGQNNAQSFAKALSESGWGIVSGMAIGIDTFAHRGCLNAGGATIAVLGVGLAQNYPKRNKALRDEILANGGCVISELPVHVPPKAENFPRRNRIISGLSYGTLVVEAAIKSGSLITAKYATEQNREVFALPGNINCPLAKGCHQLLKNGAKLVEQLEDINEEFLFLLQSVADYAPKRIEKNANQSLASDQLLASVDYETTCLDVVVQRSRLPISEVTAKLLEYELRGLVASVPGGYIRLGE